MKHLPLWMGQICKSPSCFFESKQKTNSEKKKEITKATRSQKQNWKQIFCKIKRIMESWKLSIKSKLQYFPKILGAEKPIKGHKHQGKRDKAS